MKKVSWESVAALAMGSQLFFCKKGQTKGCEALRRPIRFEQAPAPRAGTRGYLIFQRRTSLVGIGYEKGMGLKTTKEIILRK